MKGYKKWFRCFGVFLFCTASFSPVLNAQSKKNKDPYINNDSTDIYSTHPSRPFKYGYNYTKEECRFLYGEYLKELNLKKGDVIADVGAASGWEDGIFSVLADSITFYIEDIDTVYLNPVQFDRVISHYSSLRNSPQTNSFKYVIGTQKETTLPDSLFDVVLINNAFHEMSYPIDMLKDVSHKLKPGGRVIISESFSNQYKTIRHKGCDIKAYTTWQVINCAAEAGLYLTAMSQPENSFYNMLTFQADWERSDSFYTKKSVAADYLKPLDKLNKRKIAKDPEETIIAETYLKAHLPEITKAYESVKDYLNALGYQWLKKKKYEEAINIFKINTALYPKSSYVFDSLGGAYWDNGDYQLAYDCYAKSVELDPDNTDGKESLVELKEIIRDE